MPQLAAPVATFVGSRVAIRSGGEGKPGQVTLASRTGFASHLRIVQRAASTEHGVWISDDTASQLGVLPGDTATLSLSGLRATVPVAAIYHNLASMRSTSFWAPLSTQIYSSNPETPAPPPLLLAGQTDFLKITTALEDSGRYGWTFSLRAGSVRDMTLGMKMAVSNREETLKVDSEVTKAPIPVLDTFLLKANDFAREPGAKPNFEGIQAMLDIYADTGMISKKLNASQFKHPNIVAPIE